MANRVANSVDAATYFNVNEGDYIIDDVGANLGRTIDEPTLALGTGNKICIAGHLLVPQYSYIILNMPMTLDGTEDRIITNFEGQFRWGLDTGSHVFVRVAYGNRRFRITGRYDPALQTGDPNFRGHADRRAFAYGKYGLYAHNRFEGTGQGAFAIDATDYEIDFAQVGCGFFAGFSLKRDNPPIAEQEATTFDVHDCLIFAPDSEGFYTGFNSNRANDGQNILRNCKVHDNLLFMTATEPWQLGNGGDGIDYYNNVAFACNAKWKHPFNRFQDNAVQWTTRYGEAKFRNNLVMGAGEKFLSILNEAGTGMTDNPQAGQNTVIEDNYFAYCRRFVAYIFNSDNPDGITAIVIRRNVFDKIVYTYDEVYTNEPPFTDLIQCLEDGTPVLIEDNEYPNTYSLITTSNANVTVQNNISFASRPDPVFANSGFPDYVTPEKIEWYAETVGEDQAAFPSFETRKGETIVYNLNDVVMKPTAAGEPRFYRSQVANNTALITEEQTTAEWEFWTWYDNENQEISYVPPLDLRVIDDIHQSYGLTSNTIIMGMPTATKQFLFTHLGTLGTWKLVILTNAHTISVSDSFYSDISANEFPAGGDYTAGGITLTNVTFNVSGSLVNIDFDDPAILNGLTGTASKCALIVDTGTPTTSRIVAQGDLGTERVLSNGSLDLNVQTDGIYRF